MREFFLVLVCVVSLIGNIGALIGGLAFAGRPQCERFYNSDYIFPGRKLGCWLAEVAE